MAKVKSPKQKPLSGLITLTESQIAAIRSDSGIAFGSSNTPRVETPYEYRDISQDAHFPTRKPRRYSTLYDSTVAEGVAGSDTTVGTVAADCILSDWTLSWVAYADQMSNLTTFRTRLEIIRNGDTIWIQDGIDQTKITSTSDSFCMFHHSNGSNNQLVLLAGDVINLYQQYYSANLAAASCQVRCFACINTIPFR